MAFLLGSLGVLAFSFSLPATRLAVEQLDPVVVGVGRAVVAAALAAALLALLRQPRPRATSSPASRWSASAWSSASRCSPRWRSRASPLRTAPW